MNRIIDALDKLWSVLIERGSPAPHVRLLKVVVRELLFDHIADPYNTPSHPANQYGKKEEPEENLQRLYTSINNYLNENVSDYASILRSMFVTDSDSDSDDEHVPIYYYMACVMIAFMAYVETLHASGAITEPPVEEPVQPVQQIESEQEPPEQPEQVEQSAGQLEFIGDWA
jgi:hypothetical protein